MREKNRHGYPFAFPFSKSVSHISQRFYALWRLQEETSPTTFPQILIKLTHSGFKISLCVHIGESSSHPILSSNILARASV